MVNQHKRLQIDNLITEHNCAYLSWFEWHPKKYMSWEMCKILNKWNGNFVLLIEL